MERIIQLTIKTDGAYCGDETGDCPHIMINRYTICKCGMFSEHGNVMLTKPSMAKGYFRSRYCLDYFGEKSLRDKEEEMLMK